MIEAVQLVFDRQRDATQRGALNVWTVYDHPRDIPDKFVARRFETGKQGAIATDDILVTADLEELREVFERVGLYRMNRQERDDPKIVETWL
jgi:hypothetical protein